ncbi:hypothetical protein [Nonomuraea typhae]|uniref:hypothetical protein n=1 Tax=Nonomuraea typhae TaxID=2603600 RepID=UPI0012FB3567|nr:hypothetical protein [Nonomuraea typhae]
MPTISDEDILYAVSQRSRQDAEYRRQLDRAIKRKDEDDIARLVRKAVKKILGIIVDVTFDIIEILLGGRGRS